MSLSQRCQNSWSFLLLYYILFYSLFWGLKRGMLFSLSRLQIKRRQSKRSRKRLKDWRFKLRKAKMTKRESRWKTWQIAIYLLIEHLITYPSRCKEIIFAACHSGKLKLTFTSPDVISTSPKSFLKSRIDFIVLLLFEFLKKHHLPVGQVKNRIH